MTNFSGIGRQGLWSWLTPERAVLVVPVLAGLGLSVVMFSAGVTPLSLRVKEQQEVVEQLTYKSEVLPLLQQQLSELKQKQLLRDQQLVRLLSLVAGTSNYYFLAPDELSQFHQVSITRQSQVQLNVSEPQYLRRQGESGQHRVGRCPEPRPTSLRVSR